MTYRDTGSILQRKVDLCNEEWDRTFQLISWWDVERVRSAKVMVVGAGALGNEVLKNLALLNVGYILIIDFDRVEYDNLSRSVLFRESDARQGLSKAETAARRLREINPNVQVKVIEGDIAVDVGLGVYRRMDVVIGCLDNRLARLCINQHCQRVDKIWVDGAIENMLGQVNVFKPGVSCYASGLQESDWEQIERRKSCYTLAQRNIARGKIATTPISASIVAAMQVQEALKVIHHNHEQLMAGQRFYYDGMNNLAMMLRARPIREELQEEPIRYILEARELTVDSTVGDMLEFLARWTSSPDLAIRLEHDLILELTNARTEESTEVFTLQPKLSAQQINRLKKDPLDEIRITRFTDRIDRDFPRKEKKLKDLGIPYLHIFRVQTDDDEFYLEISGDESFLEIGP